ncbi:hypothetical protein G5V58_16575 [Nocardioides anomalus]|uniref:ParB N-terminal domain-containing protein n=1 Tax=Nocardioides anomalus TaxID=2712223 RepID=A0A6G6WG12_9ACTN|nr:hypothetical protein [Nocardioides anomalus]QIG44172.1 hypothetical protein G5V58_16575 [Nocardioides anomalus]
MLNMSAWQELQLDVISELHLDPSNVRLETASNAVEADILEDLFANENALGLVEGIAQIGYLIHEIPIVVKRKGNYIVVEGNRRVAALKAIQNPLLVPEFKTRIKNLSAGIPNKSALKKISVKVAPNQSQADQLIASLHTSNLRRAWTPARQAAFFQAQIDAGRTYSQLLTRYPTIDVRKFVFRGHMVNLFKSAKYSDPALADFLQTSKWKRSLSALARIYESKDFLSLTGLEMDDKGKLSKSISDKTFALVAEHIVQGIKDGELDTRSLNSVTAPRFVLLMSDLESICAADPGAVLKPTGPSGTPPAGPPTPGGGGGTGSPPGGPTKKTAKKTAKKAAAPPKVKVRNLDLSLLSVPPTYPQAMTTLMSELSAIDIQRTPNVAVVVFRAVLERSIKSYAEINGHTIKPNKSGYVQLADALNWLHDYVNANGPKSLVQPIKAVLSGKLLNFGGSANALNAINHNHHYLVDPDEALHMWNSINSILRFALKP